MCLLTHLVQARTTSFWRCNLTQPRPADLWYCSVTQPRPADPVPRSTDIAMVCDFTVTLQTHVSQLGQRSTPDPRPLRLTVTKLEVARVTLELLLVLGVHAPPTVVAAPWKPPDLLCCSTHVPASAADRSRRYRRCEAFYSTATHLSSSELIVPLLCSSC